ncbi:MAG: biopolymer transporter ExbD [Chitinispirillaceae bacterium]|nr:biopolymer transporter ExbD [Chitinispirillaceae bacterium]
MSLSFNKKEKKSFFYRHDTSSDGIFQPQLTSLIDVMTILLVFLIKSFSTEGNIVTPAEDLILPISTSQNSPKVRCSVVITKKSLLVEGMELVPITTIVKSDSMMIPSLYKWIKVEKNKCTDSSGITELMIQCDREIEFAIVKKVMFTCSKAGFTNYTVLVMQEE